MHRSSLICCRPGDEQHPDVKPDLVADNLLTAVESILNH